MRHPNAAPDQMGEKMILDPHDGYYERQQAHREEIALSTAVPALFLRLRRTIRNFMARLDRKTERQGAHIAETPASARH